MKFIDLEQRTPEWFEYRKTRLMASESAAVLDISPYSSPYEVWLRKLGREPEKQINSHMQRGIELEDEALNWINEILNSEFKPAVVESDELPWIAASLDGIDIKRKEIVEIKCPAKKTHEIVREHGISTVYYAQIQHQLYVTGYNCAHFVSYLPGDAFCMVVIRDQKHIDQMIEDYKGFYWCLKKKIPPIPQFEVVNES